jgi:hypothetical protein
MRAAAHTAAAAAAALPPQLDQQPSAQSFFTAGFLQTARICIDAFCAMASCQVEIEAVHAHACCNAYNND